MRRMKIVVQYDGTNYVGFQHQKNGVSIQDTLEEVLSRVCNESVKIVASGRTDAGVHAIAQVCHFDIENSKIKLERIVKGSNTYLPPSVKILNAEEVDASFHAQFAAKKKTYQYVCYVAKTELPLLEGRALHLEEIPNVEAMRFASKCLVGTHDFSSFCAANSGREDFVRTVCDIQINEKQGELVGMLVFEVTGTGFLYKMVRNIVGTLLEIGFGQKQPKDMQSILQAKDRKEAGKTAPACGLYLKEVKYE